MNGIGWSGLRCICIPNALLDNPLCPYHGCTELCDKFDPIALASERQSQWNDLKKPKGLARWPSLPAEFVQDYSESDCRTSASLMIPPYNPPMLRRKWYFVGFILGFLIVGLIAAALLARLVFS
jgi:hypothetical protein